MNVLTGEVAEISPWLAAHQDVNAIDLAGAPGALADDLAVAAAGNLKRVVRFANPDWSAEPGLERMFATLETKTIWHPLACSASHGARRPAAAQPSAGMTSAAIRSMCSVRSHSGVNRIISAPASITARTPATHSATVPVTAAASIAGTRCPYMPASAAFIRSRARAPSDGSIPM